jgi:hypothetical protein
VAAVDAEIFHYGFVRPPRLMQRKNKAFRTIHWGAAQAEQEFQGRPDVFDYGNLSRLAVYDDTPPAVMAGRSPGWLGISSHRWCWRRTRPGTNDQVPSVPFIEQHLPMAARSSARELPSC